DEYEAHISDKKCPAKECISLLTYTIDKDKCIGCTLCAKKCPANAITGELKKPHEINPELCVRCDQCRRNCRFGAISVE
ncbi:MAG: 4Fe-4S binding protein, partial [Clostridia bacterium]|nr:4Fe-4S binding protein [Clostridia bacterium]